MTITIFTGLVKLNKNLVGTAVVYERLAYFLDKHNFKINIVVPEETDNKIENINYYKYNNNIK